MTTVGEIIHTNNPVGYWRFDEDAAVANVANAIKDVGRSQSLHGTGVGPVVLGDPPLVAGSRGSLRTGPGAYVSVPNSDTLDIRSPLTIGGWFTPSVDRSQYAPGIHYKLDDDTTTMVNSGTWASSNGTYVRLGVTEPHLNQLGAIPGVTGESVLLLRDDLNQINVPDNANTRLNAGAFTIGFFFALKSGIANQTLFAKGDWTTADGYALLFQTNGELQFIRNNVTKTYTITGIDVVKFFHIALVYNGTTLKWYINGVLKQTDTVTYPANAGPEVLKIGDGFARIDGWYDDFVIYDVALPDAEVAKLAIGYPSNTPGSSWFGGLQRTNTFRLVWQSFSRGWTFDVWVGGARQLVENSNFHLNRGQRYFVVGTYGFAEGHRLYVDGVLVAGPGPSSSVVDSTENALSIGRAGIAGTEPWIGNIDDVFLLNTVLGATTIAQMAANASVGPSAVCLPAPTPSRERIVYIRPDVAGARKYLLHAPPSRVVLSEEGFGTPPLEYVTDRAPFQHGDSVRSFHLNPRQVQLVTMQNFSSRAEYQNGRQSLLEVLRPNALTGFLSDPARQGKLLCYLANGQKRQLDVLLDSGPGFAPPQGGWREWSFTEVLRFTAREPTWYNPLRKEVTLAASGVGGATFPIEFPITFESLNYGEGSTIAYLGDWPSYPIVTIYGPVTSPSVINQSTGHSITLNTTIPEGYAVILDLTPGVKSVTRSDGLGLLGFVSDDSDLTDFAIYPDPVVSGGANLIVVTGTATEADTPEPTIAYYDRYIGI